MSRALRFTCEDSEDDDMFLSNGSDSVGGEEDQNSEPIEAV